MQNATKYKVDEDCYPAGVCALEPGAPGFIFDKVYNQNACDAGTTRVSETRCQRPLKIAKAARLPALRAGKCCAEGYSWARKRENLNPNVCDG